MMRFIAMRQVDEVSRQLDPILEKLIRHFITQRKSDPEDVSGYTDRADIFTYVFGENDIKTRKIADLPSLPSPFVSDFHPFLYLGEGKDRKAFSGKMFKAIAKEFLKEAFDQELTKTEHIRELTATLFVIRFRFIIFIDGADGFVFTDKWHKPKNVEAKIQSFLSGTFKLWIVKLLEEIAEDPDKVQLVTQILRDLQSAIGIPKISSRVVSMLQIFSGDVAERALMYSRRVNFDNGVIDLNKSALELEKYSPSDFSTTTTGYDFKVPTQDERNWIIAFMTSLFQEEAEYEYAWDELAWILEGNNIFRVFNVLKGPGGNGKSGLQALVEKALGKYAVSVSPDILTVPLTSPNAPTPALESLKGKLVAFASEPNAGRCLLGANIKSLTGNDTLSSRGLYQDIGWFVNRARIIMVCNDLPKVDVCDQAFTDRIEALPFRTTFCESSKVEKAKADQEILEKCSTMNRKKTYIATLDPHMNERAKTHAPAFLYMLMERFLEIKNRTGRNVPPTVRAYTEVVATAQSPVKEFVNAKLVGPTLSLEGTALSTPLSDVFTAYSWFMEQNMPRAKILDMFELQKELNHLVRGGDIFEKRDDGVVAMLAFHIKKDA